MSNSLSLLSFKRTTMSESILTKEQPWAIHSGHSWQKSDLSKSLSSLCKKELLSKTSNLLKKITFFVGFWQFFFYFSPFWCPIANRSHHSLLSHSFSKSDGSDSFLSLLTEERPWVNRSHCSLQISDQSWAIHSHRSWQKSNRNY